MFSRKSFVPTFVLALALTGCANGYKQFYQAAGSVTQEQLSAMRLAPPLAIPVIEQAQPGDLQLILDAYARRGYVVIGESSFNGGPNVSDDAALRQARDVGADLVLILNRKYAYSNTSPIPITTPTTTTSNTTGTFTAYGIGAPITVFGSGSTTTFGTTTTYVPSTVHRYDYGALYFIRWRASLGAFFRDLNDTERQELQTNRGAVIRLVVDGTPAFDADMLPGDVVVSVDGLPVSNTEAFGRLLGERRGKLVSVSLLRRGQRHEKEVRLNP